MACRAGRGCLAHDGCDALAAPAAAFVTCAARAAEAAAAGGLLVLRRQGGQRRGGAVEDTHVAAGGGGVAGHALLLQLLLTGQDDCTGATRNRPADASRAALACRLARCCCLAHGRLHGLLHGSRKVFGSGCRCGRWRLAVRLGDDALDRLAGDCITPRGHGAAVRPLEPLQGARHAPAQPRPDAALHGLRRRPRRLAIGAPLTPR